MSTFELSFGSILFKISTKKSKASELLNILHIIKNISGYDLNEYHTIVRDNADNKNIKYNDGKYKNINGNRNY